MNDIDRWLDNLKEDALKQALRFVLEAENPKNAIVFIKQQIDEFALMYKKVD